MAIWIANRPLHNLLDYMTTHRISGLLQNHKSTGENITGYSMHIQLLSEVLVTNFVPRYPRICALRPRKLIALLTKFASRSVHSTSRKQEPQKVGAESNSDSQGRSSAVQYESHHKVHLLERTHSQRRKKIYFVLKVADASADARGRFFRLSHSAFLYVLFGRIVWLRTKKKLPLREKILLL